MHQALYRKWRPESFDDVSGQEHITSVLRYENEQGKLSHAYLFCGSRGVGKTTCAKILAKAVNCLSPINGNPCGECEACRSIDSGAATDVLEMDAASNNGVDNIRDIRDEVVYAPASLKYRVYIVDEVHMLSQSAFNALLKTLEEPPSYVIFILATTEQHKLPATIISRCQRFEFRRISIPELSARIEFIAKEEGISLEKDAALLIARLSQGGMRDAISLLELCAGGGRTVTPELVNETVGSTGREGTMQMAECVAAKNYDGIFELIADTVQSSKDLYVFFQDLLSLWRDLLVFKTLPDPSRYLDLTESESAKLTEISRLFSKETLLWHSGIIERGLEDMKNPGASKRTVAELSLLKMCDEQLDSSNEALLSRISKLETAMITGNIAPRPTAPAVTSPPVVAEPTVSEKPPVETEVQEASIITPVVENKEQNIQKTEKKADAKRSLRCWAEVVERISADNRMIGSFVRTARAYTEGNRLCVRVKNEFARDMIDSDDTRAVIKATVASLSGKNYDVFVELGSDEPETDSDITDEILESAEEL